MSGIAPLSSSTVQPNAQRPDGKPSKPQQDGPSSATTAAAAKVGAIDAQVTYSAGLETIRSANKLMMGYLLNVKV